MPTLLCNKRNLIYWKNVQNNSKYFLCTILCILIIFYEYLKWWWGLGFCLLVILVMNILKWHGTRFIGILIAHLLFFYIILYIYISLSFKLSFYRFIWYFLGRRGVAEMLMRRWTVPDQLFLSWYCLCRSAKLIFNLYSHNLFK